MSDEYVYCYFSYFTPKERLQYYY